MSLTLLFIGITCVLVLFPIFGSFRRNLRLFLSFVLATSVMAILEVTLFRHQGNSISLFAQSFYNEISFYFDSMQLDAETSLQMIRFSILILIYFALIIISKIIFNLVIKEKSYFSESKNGLSIRIGNATFLVFNSMCIAFIICLVLSGFNLVWNLNEGFLSRLFSITNNLVKRL